MRHHRLGFRALLVLGLLTLPATAQDITAVPTCNTVLQGPAVYVGGTIAAGATAQPWLAQNAKRRGFTIQNQSSGDLYIKIGGTATLTNFSLKIAPGVLYETPVHHASAGAVSIIGATTGQAFYATEFWAVPASAPPLSPTQAAAIAVAALPRLVTGAIPAGNTVVAQAETAFASKLTIPAGTLGPGFAIRDLQFGVYTSSGVTPAITPRVRLGGVLLFPARAITGLLASTNAPWRAESLFIVTDQGIIGTGVLTIDDNQIRIFGTAAPVTGVNYAVDNDFTSSAQWGQASCTITLQGRTTEVFKTV